MAESDGTKRPPTLDFARLVRELQGKAPEYHGDRPPVRNINEVTAEQMTLGQRISDRFAATMGSWRFIIIQSMLLIAWVILNITAWIHRWDPYPFILLNLALSFQAAYAAPIIMMSQNRQALKDRIAAEHDFQINITAEEEVKQILSHLRYQDELILTVLAHMESHLRGHGDAVAGSPD